MNHYKRDNLIPHVGMSLVDADNVGHDVEVQSGKEDTTRMQSVSSDVQSNPDATKILGRLREKHIVVN